MILEVAMLQVKPGLETQFETDFLKASVLISSMQGYINHSLKKCIEHPNKYLLLVNWDQLEDHTLDLGNHHNIWNGVNYCIIIMILFL
jgi:heme-degrading monooxygenase HmoA